MKAHACNLIIYEAEIEEFLVLTGQFSWLRESSNFIERPWLKQRQKKLSDDDPDAIKQSQNLQSHIHTRTK